MDTRRINAVDPAHHRTAWASRGAGGIAIARLALIAKAAINVAALAVLSAPLFYSDNLSLRDSEDIAEERDVDSGVIAREFTTLAGRIRRWIAPAPDSCENAGRALSGVVRRGHEIGHR